jgi:hypothetical protein
MAPFEALYGRRCRTPLNWSELGEQWFFRPDLVKEMEEKVQHIRYNLREAHARQKNYVDKRRRPLIFQVGDHVYLNVSPMKGVSWFGVSSPNILARSLFLNNVGRLRTNSGCQNHYRLYIMCSTSHN